jgi:hypothetical protein
MNESQIQHRTKHEKGHHGPASTEAPTHDEHTHSSHALDEDNRHSHAQENDLNKKERKIAMKYRLAINLAGLAAVIIVGILGCAGNARAFPVQSIRISTRALDTNYSKVDAIDPTIIERDQVMPSLAGSIQVQSRARNIVVIDRAIAGGVMGNLRSTNAIRVITNAINTVDLADANIDRNNLDLDAINLNVQSLDLDPANRTNPRIADTAIVCSIDDLNSLDRPGLETFSPRFDR